MAKGSIQSLAIAIAKKYKLSNVDATKFVEAIFDIVTEELKNNGQVKIKGLGTFKVQSVKPRESVNVNTGERVLIEGHDKISFTPDATMKELVNKPFSQFETVVLNDGVDFEEEKTPIDDTSDEDDSTSEDISMSNSEEIPIEKSDKTLLDDVTVVKHKELKPIICEGSEQQKEVVEALYTSETSAPCSEGLKIERDEDNIVENEEFKVDDDDSDTIEKSTSSSKSTIVIDEVKKTSGSTPLIGKSTLKPDVKKETAPIEDLKRNRQTASMPVDDFDDGEPTDDEREMRTLWRILVCVLVITVLAFGGYYIKQSFNDQRESKEVVKKNIIKTSKEIVLVSKKKTPPPAPQSSVTDTTSSENDEAAKYVSLSSDPKIRYGAYNIIGIEKVVVLKKGETMASYSRKSLGPDMVGYFQVLNGVDEMKEGDTLKVPKVEYRPQYQNRK